MIAAQGSPASDPDEFLDTLVPDLSYRFNYFKGMSVFQQWKLRGPVRTLRTEFAEWDITNEQWQAPRRFCLVQLRPDGRVVEQEDHNPNGSFSRSRYTYDDAGHLLETTFQLDEGPIYRRLNRYDELGRLVRTLSTDSEGLERDF
jgi:YD repeat-containing protein